MLKIGITGGIGSGKTTISAFFEILGVPVFYADEEARLVMHNDELLIKGLKETFGEETYSDNQLNRKHLSEIVFKDHEKLAKLNELVHPAVFRAFDRWVTLQRNVPYVMKEAALLFESGSYKLCDKTILVTSPEQLKIDRVVKRSGISQDEVLARISKQFTDEQSSKLADFIIRNDEQQLLIPQVLKLHKQFLSLAKHA